MNFASFGFYWLYTPVTLLERQDIPAAGWLSLPLPAPSEPPPGPTYPAQAWIGKTLSRPVLLDARAIQGRIP